MESLVLVFYAQLLITHYSFIFSTVTNFGQGDHPQNTKCAGQTLVEFMFLLIVIILMSRIFVAGINTGIGTVWEDFANIIIKGTQDNNPNPVSLF